MKCNTLKAVLFLAVGTLFAVVLILRYLFGFSESLEQNFRGYCLTTGLLLLFYLCFWTATIDAKIEKLKEEKQKDEDA